MKHINNTIRRAMALMAVMVVATATAMAQVKYIDADGTEKTCNSFNTVVNGSNVTWSGSSNGGWYVVSGDDVTITNSVTVSGAVKLIIADDASLTITGAADKAGIVVTGSNSLTVYGQTDGTGILNATGGDKGAGIGGGKEQTSGTITINGGTITANGAGGGAGIGGGIGGSIGNFTINHGTVVANGSLLATGIGAGDNSGPETVNFGTPDLNWSKYNLGATNGTTKESWYGDYYAWGETATKADYSWSKYKFCSGSSLTLTKYNNESAAYGTVDNKTVLEADDDAAHAVLGGSWRMPTEKEWQDLCNNNTFVWLNAGATYNDVVPSFKAVAAGYLVIKGKEGVGDGINTSVYMFLPAAGYRYGTSLSLAGSDADYWSSSLGEGDPRFACSLYFGSGYVGVDGIFHRNYGKSVRPVCQ